MRRLLLVADPRLGWLEVQAAPTAGLIPPAAAVGDAICRRRFRHFHGYVDRRLNYSPLVPASYASFSSDSWAVRTLAFSLGASGCS